MYMNLWLRVPLLSTWELLNDEVDPPRSENGKSKEDSWEQWNTFRTLCEHQDKLSVGELFHRMILSCSK